ncbi:hypothetical protein C8046_16190 [Serinibacter arcticus]|uniref:Uncharacterized protein n=2 Tax=Serinibacter arcticus TaxID=1655435 RepID=A0A2U1ZY84_9MICO|nr:hypothetical protein C8046_16190 [Serinibacter arcticus]
MLILGYLVPSLVRRRQAAGDSCVDDRFSQELRVVARGGAGGRPRQETRLPSTRALVVSPSVPGPRGEELTVNRPTGMADRRTANEARRVAAVRAALAARRAEQAAAARRRLVLTVALVLVSGISWAAVALAQFSFLLAAFPTVVLAAVLWLGVRTARAERAEWAQVPTSLTEPRATRAAGPTYSPSQLRSHLSAEGAARPDAAPSDAAAGRLSWQTDDVPVEVPVEAEPEPVEVVAEVEEPAVAGSWTPVPVPVPTYTLKPVAVRREAAPYEAPVAPTTAEADVSLEVSIDEGIDLRAVLARRRAVGA